MFHSKEYIDFMRNYEGLTKEEKIRPECKFYIYSSILILPTRNMKSHWA